LAANETSIKQSGEYRENVICPPGAIILLPRDINNAARAHKTERDMCAALVIPTNASFLFICRRGAQNIFTALQ
jgi:hypothetical protein